jgi:hypothetical protein
MQEHHPAQRYLLVQELECLKIWRRYGTLDVRKRCLVVRFAEQRQCLYFLITWLLFRVHEL